MNARIENGSAIGNGNADYLEYFNSDIICHHGQLCIQEVKRKLVCGNVWKKFKSYFPTARAFPKSSMPCNFCMDNDDKVKKVELVSKELNHFGVIAGLFRQIGGHSSRLVLFCSF